MARPAGYGHDRAPRVPAPHDAVLVPRDDEAATPEADWGIAVDCTVRRANGVKAPDGLSRGKGNGHRPRAKVPHADLQGGAACSRCTTRSSRAGRRGTLRTVPSTPALMIRTGRCSTSTLQRVSGRPVGVLASVGHASAAGREKRPPPRLGMRICHVLLVATSTTPTEPSRPADTQMRPSTDRHTCSTTVPARCRFACVARWRARPEARPRRSTRHRAAHVRTVPSAPPDAIM